MLYAIEAMKPRLVCALLLSAAFAGVSLAAAGQESDSGLAERTARHSPAWLTSGVIYEINPRSFSLEGNLKGITGQLDRLHSLGVNVLWLMPIQPTGLVKKKGSLGSPYSIRDYYAIDPQYGTKDDLKSLVSEAHRRQMKVILDVVANHTAWDSVLMAHPDFYKRDREGHILSPHDWNDVAALDYSNPKLRRYMTDMLVYWIREFDLDGYRCDVAFEVPTDFWEQARKELEAVKPDIMMLAEASKPELLRSAFDIDYSWPLLSALNAVVMRGESAGLLRSTIEEQKAMFPKGALHMRMSDDHDEERAIARYGSPGALAASALMFTLDGVPMLYNGMEAGDSTESGDPALFEPLKVLWQMSQRRPQFPSFYAGIIPLRKRNPALRTGTLLWVHNSDEQHVITYIRQSPEEELLIAINLSNTPFRGTVESPSAHWEEIALPGLNSKTAALPALALDAFQFRVFVAAAAKQ